MALSVGLSSLRAALEREKSRILLQLKIPQHGAKWRRDTRAGPLPRRTAGPGSAPTGPLSLPSASCHSDMHTHALTHANVHAHALTRQHTRAHKLTCTHMRVHTLTVTRMRTR